MILWVLTYLLVAKKRTDLIAGFDREKISDPDRYASWIGVSTFLCGFGLLTTWSLIASELMAAEFMLAAVFVSAAISILIAFISSARYRK